MHFSMPSSLGKSCHKASLHLISKLTMKRIVSFSLTPRATAHNNDDILTFAILEYKLPFSRNLTIKISNLYYICLNLFIVYLAYILSGPGRN